MIEVDPHPFARGGSAALCVVSAMNVYLAWLILHNPLAMHATNLTALALGFRAIDAPGGIYFIAAVMIVAAALTMVGVIARLGFIRVLTFFPQLVLLAATAYGGQWASWHGHYLDGTAHYPNGVAIPWEHISADQIAWLALFLVYASAMARRCWEPNW